LVLKSKTIMITHSLGDFHGVLLNPLTQNIILLDHGIPMKRNTYIGGDKKEIPRFRTFLKRMPYTIVTSDFTKYLYSAREYVDARKIYITGYPRNDKLLHDANLKKKGDYRIRNILYAPTWRERATELFPFDDFNFEKLTEFLEKNNLKLYVRFHPHNYKESKEKAKKYFECPNIIDLSPDKLEDIQDFLPNTDILITDYSSIMLDFLILGRHIFIISYDPSNLALDFTFFSPGPLIKSFDDLLHHMEDILQGDDVYKIKREYLRHLIYNRIDDKSCYRVRELVRSLL